MASTVAQTDVSEALGPKIRRQRRRLGLTLDELAGRTRISKPYLSLIETGRVANPPSDEKLRRLEQTLGFTAGELLTQAHLLRTPRDVRAVLHQLMSGEGSEFRMQGAEALEGNSRSAGEGSGAKVQPSAKKVNGGTVSTLLNPDPRILNSPSDANGRTPHSVVDLDAACLTGMLKGMADRASGGGVGQMTANAVPVINRVSAGYPRNFSDLSNPPRAADEYVSCPDIHDRQAFAARVHGDSMMPKYRESDIVIFSPALSPRDGDDCFIRFTDGQTTFKRIFFETGEGGQPNLRLQPRNERYKPQVVTSELLAGMYKAVYRYQRVDED